MTKQFNNFFDENYIRNLQFDSFETDITVLSSNSYKLVSKTCNNIVVLKKISFSNKYAIKDFINDLNWNEKLNFAKQLVNAIKCLHESDIVHLNLNPKNIFVHKGNLKLNEFGAFQYRNKILNKFKLIQYTDPQYLENPKTYKLNKSSDIYSIGVLLWEISSGIAPFKSELSYDFNLLSAIIYGKRESAIPGTPKNYVKIYTECWKYDPNLRPTIQHVFKEIINIHYNYEEIIAESIKDKEYKEKPTSKIGYSNSTSLLQHFINLRYEMIKELEIISSIIATHDKTLTSLDFVRMD
ncbi:kinase-like domain-containing protein [Gigaspora margarita]|uniref:Kinase-like domain-containing protein n=1 Tax=Gigaspora margarita TaxID=4874 RepID=A0A8H3XPA6_GIGMA|nr:kinase-like domain-containing protein [Gigaspora margarita]